MPDHFHAIVWILDENGEKPDIDNRRIFDCTNNDNWCDNRRGDWPIAPAGNTPIWPVTTDTNIDSDNNPTKIPNMQPKSLSSFIAGFKSAVTTKINELIINKYGPESNKIYTRKNRLFQVNFNDSIIWNDEDMERIRQYIINNPKNWKK